MVQPSPLDYAVVIGGANVDILGTAHSPLAMGDSNPGRVRCAPGGVARNIAENLARLGCGTHLLSAVGDDLFGSSLLASTAHAGVKVDHCWTLLQASTSTYVSLHDTHGDMAVAVNDMDIVERVSPELLSQQAALLQQAAVWVLDCNLSAQALAWCCNHHSSVPIFVDGVSAFKCLRIAPWLAKVHTIKLNQLEAQALCQLPCSTLPDRQAIAQHLHTQGVQNVVISLGSQGVFYSSQSTGDAQRAASGQLQALPCDAVNTTGAGDALMAGLVYAYLHKQSLPQAAEFAQGCAALTVGCEAANHPGLSVAAVTQLLDA